MAGSGWSDLPLDLFSLVFSKLSLPQFLRSAAVCDSWSASVRDLSTRGGCFKFRGQSPWLVLNDNDPRAGDPSAVITFYALDEAREYTIPIPDPPISDRILIGSAHGWIITIDVRLLVQLLNPITGAQIDLPRLSRLFHSEHTDPAVRDTAGRLIGFMMPIPSVLNDDIYSRLRLEQLHFKAILSADPSLGDGYTVALMQSPSGRIFLTHSAGDDQKWFELNNPLLIQDMVFHKGKLYMSAFSAVYYCDLAQIQRGEMPRFRVVDQFYRLLYLFETPRGDLLSIWSERYENPTKTCISFKVHKVIDDDDDDEEIKPNKRVLEKTMDNGELLNYLLGGREVVDYKEKPILLREETNDLEDLIVFLDGRNPFFISSSDFPHLKPNSIYFINEHDMISDPEFIVYGRMFRERNSQRYDVYYSRSHHYHLRLIFFERNWFRNILNCPIFFTMDQINFVRLYWHPPSSSINH